METGYDFSHLDKYALNMFEDHQPWIETSIDGYMENVACPLLSQATISAAVYDGHRFERELGETKQDISFGREITELTGEFKLP